MSSATVENIDLAKRIGRVSLAYVSPLGRRPDMSPEEEAAGVGAAAVIGAVDKFFHGEADDFFEWLRDQIATCEELVAS